MLPKALLAAALATSTASAFLLPLPTDVQAERQGGHHRHHGGKNKDVVEGEADAAVSLVSPFYHEFTKVKVPCPGCSMQIRKHGHKHDDDDKASDNEDGKIITLTDVANHINLFFKIDHQADGDHLLVNHFELYPNVDINGDGLQATQAPDHFHHKGKQHHHHDKEEKEHGEKKHDGEKHDGEKHDGEKHDGEKHDGEKHDGEKHEHHEHEEHDDHDEELKKRHRRHRKHNDDDDKDVEPKHWKHKEHDVDSKEDKDVHGKHHGKHGKHGKHLVKVPLGYAMQTQAVGQDASNGMEVVALSLEIIEVNGVFVQGIPAVNIRLIRTEEGGLMIARVDIVGDETETETTEVAHPMDPMDALKEQLDACSNILCRWKAIITSGIKAHHGGCAGKAMAKAFGDKNGDEEKPHRHHHHHHHKGGDDSDSDDNNEPKPHHHHKPLREHSWKQLAKKFASHILFPVMVGVTAGILVSVIGMVVGTALVGLWRLVVRRGGRKTSVRTYRHRHSRSSKAAIAAAPAADRHADEEAVDEEKAGLIATASTEELPPYQDKDTKSGSA